MLLFILKLSEGKDICTVNQVSAISFCVNNCSLFFLLNWPMYLCLKMQKEVTINHKRRAMFMFTYKEELTKIDLDDATYNSLRNQIEKATKNLMQKAKMYR